jgi:hypothetical protein
LNWGLQVLKKKKRKKTNFCPETDSNMSNDSEEAAVMSFELLKASVIREGLPTARLGRLVLASRPSLDTPNYFGITSRGVVPHVTPDNVSRYLPIGGAYMALEDCKWSLLTWASVIVIIIQFFFFFFSLFYPV